MKYYQKKSDRVQRRYPTNEYIQDFYNMTNRRCLKMEDIRVLEKWGVKMEEIEEPEEKTATIFEGLLK